jgi:hypothetical protein
MSDYNQQSPTSRFSKSKTAAYFWCKNAVFQTDPLKVQFTVTVPLSLLMTEFTFNFGKNQLPAMPQVHSFLKEDAIKHGITEMLQSVIL